MTTTNHCSPAEVSLALLNQVRSAHPDPRCVITRISPFLWVSFLVAHGYSMSQASLITPDDRLNVHGSFTVLDPWMTGMVAVSRSIDSITPHDLPP